jgi:hypothetical protein
MYNIKEQQLGWRCFLVSVLIFHGCSLSTYANTCAQKGTLRAEFPWVWGRMMFLASYFFFSASLGEKDSNSSSTLSSLRLGFSFWVFLLGLFLYVFD